MRTPIVQEGDLFGIYSKLGGSEIWRVSREAVAVLTNMSALMEWPFIWVRVSSHSLAIGEI